MQTVGDENQSLVPAVLIILYRRFNNLHQISEVIFRAKIPRIYLAVDVPPLHLQTYDYLLERNNSIEQLRNECHANGTELFLWMRSDNYGCARSVITACKWFYSNEEFGAVLEDDCLPSLEFFAFLKSNRKRFESESNMSFICGTQHAHVTNASKNVGYIVSSYPFLWGWATSREKWEEMSRNFICFSTSRRVRNVSVQEVIYWRAGIRRALKRYVDVWDTIIVGYMVLNGLYCMLPVRNLIINKGLDEFATNHTAQDSQNQWDINLIGEDVWNELDNVNNSIRNNFLKIRWYTPIRNSIRYILDAFSSTKRITLPEQLTRDFQAIPPASIE